MAGKVNIIGGGIIGLSSAWHLHQSGWKVTVLESGDLEDNCSFGNAGYISPSHVIPLSAPGMIGKSLQWMFDGESPFYIPFRMDARLMRWLWHFGRNANERHVLRSRQPLADMCMLSRETYREMIRVTGIKADMRQDGLLLLYQTQQQARAEAADAEHARATGQEVKLLSKQAIEEMDPDMAWDIAGGVYYPGDAHLTPDHFMRGLRDGLHNAGVEIITNCRVKTLERHHRNITGAVTDLGSFPADAFVLSAGVWSAELGGSIGWSAPMAGAKGYHLDVTDPPVMPRYPFILCERKIAVTPMNGFLRFGGTLELGAVSSTINPHRIKGIVKGLKMYLPQFREFDFSRLQPWSGIRPCTPDGLPYIGRLNAVDNLIIATGHAMLGMTMGAATGGLVSSILNQTSPAIDLKPFDPERFR